MERNERGEVDNPLRANIAACLEAERNRRKLRHQHFAELFRTAPGEGLAYRTYIQIIRQKNNVTLRTLDRMAKALDLSIATLLAGDADLQPSAHHLNAESIRTRLANVINTERKRGNLLRYEMAERLGVSDITFTKLERAAGNVSVDTIAAIAIALDQDPATFLFRENQDKHEC